MIKKGVLMLQCLRRKDRDLEHLPVLEDPDLVKRNLVENPEKGGALDQEEVGNDHPHQRTCGKEVGLEVETERKRKRVIRKIRKRSQKLGKGDQGLGLGDLDRILEDHQDLTQKSHGIMTRRKKVLIQKK